MTIQRALDDAISRAEVKRLVDFYKEQYDGIFLLNESIDKLPSVQPSRNKGHWLRVATIKPKDFCNRCSECEYEQFYAERYNFCPNCGADMRGGTDE